MNYKSARCSMHCFDSTSVAMAQVNHCLKVCREGIQECEKFTQKVQDDVREEHEQCTKKASNLNSNLKDPIVHWMACHEKLILRFDSMEKKIKDEFSNFV